MAKSREDLELLPKLEASDVFEPAVNIDTPLAGLLSEDDELELPGDFQEPSDWWTQFNKGPMRFDLSDPRVYEAIVYGRADLVGDFGFELRDGPPLEVLRNAKMAAGINMGMEITATSVYRRWENSKISGSLEEEEQVEPSLDERRAAQAMRREGAEGDAFYDGLPVYGGGEYNTEGTVSRGVYGDADGGGLAGEEGDVVEGYAMPAGEEDQIVDDKRDLAFRFMGSAKRE